MRKPKTGRRASDRERTLAGEIVNLYEKAKAESNGLFFMGNSDDGTPMFFDGNDPNEALQALKNFAKNGTFEYVEIELAELLCLHIEYDELRQSGIRYSDAIHQLALNRNTSERTIERYLKKEPQSLPFFDSSVKFSK